METLINLVTVEGSTILDPFSGSGTTGVACMNTHRKGIMIGMDENYFNIGVNRIQESIMKGEIK